MDLNKNREDESKTNSSEMVPVKYGPHIDVHSEAEVLQGTVHVLAQFAPLQLNTDLNIPPSNWLRSTTEVQQYVHKSSRRPTQFSSIQMALNCPDVVGDVDVISSAENIKKLLKIPFGKTHISLMVHKIGKSLLLDDFDIHKHLFRRAQANWKWLRDFYQNQMMCIPRGSARENSLHNIGVPRESKSRDSLQNRNMYSKFLYHSVRNEAQSQALHRDHEHQQPLVLSHSHSEQHLDRNNPPREVLWTFEDIRMLIGTDLPIFCKDSYYVSLRLRDMRTPINVLTGLDYWLDNLMCNVPELAMCFHLNGFVKKYEVIKTEDIPNLPKSSFNPQVVVDIAKNILSFLKTNATKEGHTYWLYKGVNDDVVKLYDLTTLCSDTKGAEDENPFTVPVGMLLFHVARNMWQSHGRRKDATICTLLESCLFLLNKEIYSEVCASASYMLSDLYVPDSAIQNNWLTSQGEDDSDDDESVSSFQEESQSDPGPTTEVGVDNLCHNYHQDHCHHMSTIKPITSDIEERCHESLTYIHKGLVCFELHNAKKKRMESHIVEEQVRCNRDEAIPLHYEPLQKKHAVSSEDLYIAECKDVVHVGTDESSRSSSCHDSFKAKLIHKAAITFHALAKMHASQNKYRECLRLLRNALICLCGFRKLLPGKAQENTELMIHILELSADTGLLITKSAVKKEDLDMTLDEISEEESEIIECVMMEVDEDAHKWLFDLTADKEKNYSSCILCYQHCIALSQSLVEGQQDIIGSLMKRLGNAQNEMGVWYMQQAQTLLQSEGGSQPAIEMEILWRKSSNMIQQGIHTFEIAADVVNQALLHSNMGRLMRLCAQTFTKINHRKEKPEFSNQERYYFQHAKESYMKALSLLKSDHSQLYAEIADSVSWELSTTYFNMATLMQDYAPLTVHQQEDVEKEVINLMSMSLKLCTCKTETSSAKQTMYLYRAATINHRLGSLFHNSLRNQSSEQKRKYHRQLAEQHYEKSVKQYKSVDSYIEVLRVQLERIALLDFWLTSQQMPRSRLRTLFLMLHLIGECQETFGFLSNQQDESGGEEEEKGGASSSDSEILEEMKTLTKIMESRLQFVLLHLVKLYSIVNKKSKHENTYLDEVKQLYMQSLKCDKSQDILPATAQLRKHWSFLLTLLPDVTKFYLKVAQTDHDLHLPKS
ncbi:hypothetical protein CHS0354_041036 [Potamilus streckersoni]|uniref:Erythroid differentiation-related factor 1 n=1 Tax=Potamilus streckersoni TaxID=2493646 RepID=A0AAE0SE32_9BIVA|nr:hypothetical protein CHS0354_041036 [Potamilus streckersoni]